LSVTAAHGGVLHALPAGDSAVVKQLEDDSVGDAGQSLTMGGARGEVGHAVNCLHFTINSLRSQGQLSVDTEMKRCPTGE
jgi:hypothetical protein